MTTFGMHGGPSRGEHERGDLKPIALIRHITIAKIHMHPE